tara:strand:+ start:71016 stop:72686 length:1671 start_codon:yes stop_codon:yes gene_type:complete
MTNYLPRVNTILNDQGLKIAPPPAGPKVTLLGVTSNPDVPLLEPFTVGSVEKAITSLYFDLSGVAGGWPDTTFPGELAIAIEEAVSAGAPNIEVVVIGYYTGQELLDYVKPTALQSGRYEDLIEAYDVLRNRTLDVVTPVGAYIDDNVYDNASGAADTSLNFGKQLADFCFQATTEENSCVGVIAARPIMSWAMRHAPTITEPTAYFTEYTGVAGLSSDATLLSELNSLYTAEFVTGANGASAANFRSAMSATEYGTPSTRLLKEWHAYHAYPDQLAKFNSNIYSGQYSNNVYTAWQKGAADQDENLLGDIVEADATAVSSSYFASWQAFNSEGAAATDSRNGQVDAGQYLSVFSTPLRGVGTQTSKRALAVGAPLSNTSRNTDGAAAYAGLMTSLAPQSSTTNKQVGGIVQLKLLSAKQANDLTGIRHVTMYSRTSGLTIASGVTGAHNVTRYVRSDYVRLTTVRIVHATVDLIRSVANKYVGEPNNAPQMNALDAEIDQVLLSMKGSGALNGYSFSISSTPDQRVLGVLDINLTLVPAFEITTINLVVSLSKEL